MTPAAADAGGMWRVSFLLGAAPPLDVLEALEAEAASVSIFEDAVDAEQRPTRWRVDMLLEREPERSSMRRTLERLLARWNLEARDVDLRFLAHEDWLARASMPRETLRVGRFVVHGADRAADAGAGEVGLRVELGMAFGSGEHDAPAFAAQLDIHLPQVQPGHRIDEAAVLDANGLAAHGIGLELLDELVALAVRTVGYDAPFEDREQHDERSEPA